MNKFISLLILQLTWINMAFAQATVQNILRELTGALRQFIAVGVGVALVVFIWGLIRFIGQAGDEKGVAEGKQRMIWGIVGLFLIVTVWGIVTLLTQLFGVDTSGGNRCLPPVVGGSMEPCS
jgi:heme/copper-type cytochrome/quinol oxidase subunit 2